MGFDSFADCLAALDDAALAELLAARPDVLLAPVPRSFAQLAQRLSGPDSLGSALGRLNHDLTVVGETIAMLDEAATVPAIGSVTGATEPAVRRAVADLSARGMAWTTSDGSVRLPELLAAHWSAQHHLGRPVRKIAAYARASDLEAAATGLGLDVSGLRKPELTARLAESLADTPALAARVSRQPRAVRDLLRTARLAGGYGAYEPYGYGGHRLYGGFDGYDPRSDDGYDPDLDEPDLDESDVYDPELGDTPPPRGKDPMRELTAAGLAILVNGRFEVPREVAVAAWVADRDVTLSGPPELPPSGDSPAAVRSGAQAAANDAVRTVTLLLDEAGLTPVTALKKGGVGPRERSRLSRRLSLPEADLALWIDVAFVAGLLDRRDDIGYVPTPGYQGWREAEPAARWTVLAAAWFALDYAPTSRQIADGKVAPPPLPLVSAAGRVRRAMLRAARSGRSVRAAGEHVSWYVPLHGYPADLLATKVAAAVREAQLLGVVTGDTLSELGEHLTAVAGGATGRNDTGRNDTGGNDIGADDDSAEADVDSLFELTRRCAPLLPTTDSSVVVQSDLTAVVSGQPSVAVSRLLADAAVAESRGGAQLWRFTSASVRGALDAGWNADDLLTQLRATASHALPQALEYLVRDVARRHGEVRVRDVRCCVVADEVLTKEIVHTRSLASLALRQLAPTVLVSPLEPGKVLAKLRDAGHYPVAESADGAVVVERRPEHRAPGRGRPTHDTARRARLSPARLAQRLLADPTGAGIGSAVVESKTFQTLAELNRRLDDSELELLADALDQQRDVTIGYFDRYGSHTIRRIRPEQLSGRCIESWCYLRNDQREFTVANIESVSPGR